MSQSWINDQYFHPLEWSHTYDEVLESASKLKLNVSRFIPDVKNFDVEDELDLSLNKNIGNWLDRFVTQLNMSFVQNADGGLFVAILKENLNDK